MSPVMTHMPAALGKGKDPGIKVVCRSSTTTCLGTAAASAGLRNKPVVENPERISIKFCIPEMGVSSLEPFLIFCFFNLTTNDEFCTKQGFMVQELNVATSIAAWSINCLTHPPLFLLSYPGTALWARIYTSFSHCKSLINEIEWLESLQESINAKACSREENKSLLKYFPRNLQNPRETSKK